MAWDTAFASSEGKRYAPSPQPNHPLPLPALVILFGWLPTHTCHVNSIFWKLHGWIDNRIEDWKAAHGVTGEPHWVGTWMGKMEMPAMPGMQPLLAAINPHFVAIHAAIHTPEHLQNLEQALQVIAQAGVSLPRFWIDPSLLPEASTV